MPSADGFSTIRPGPGPSAGATIAHAVTAPGSAARGRHGNEKPDEETPVIARLAVHSLDLKLGILPAHKGQKFVACLLIVAETADHCAGDSLSMLLFHTSHLRAQMAAFPHYTPAFTIGFLLYRFPHFPIPSPLHPQP